MLFAPRGSNDPKSGGEWWAILDKLAAEELMFCMRVQVEMRQRHQMTRPAPTWPSQAR